MPINQTNNQASGKTCLRHYSTDNNFEPIVRPKLKIQLPARLRLPSNSKFAKSHMPGQQSPILRPSRRSFFKNFALRLEATF